MTKMPVDLRVIVLAQQRKELAADLVPEESLIQVGVILPIRYEPFPRVGFQVAPLESQQRPHVMVSLFANTGQSLQPGAFDDPRQNRFALIIGVVGGADDIKTMALCDPVELCVSKKPGGFFDGFLVPLGTTDHIHPSDKTTDSGRRRLSFHKRGILFAPAAAKLVIDVDNSDFNTQLIPDRQKKPPKNHGIQPAADRHQYAAAAPEKTALPDMGQECRFHLVPGFHGIRKTVFRTSRYRTIKNNAGITR